MFTQTSIQAGWLKIYTPTCWWKRGRGKATPCPPTARCPNTPWTSSGFGSPGRSSSSPTTTTPSGACRGPSRTKWPAWGISTGKGPKCGVEEDWSAPLTPGSTQPSGCWWTGTLDVDRKDFLLQWRVYQKIHTCFKIFLSLLCLNVKILMCIWSYCSYFIYFFKHLSQYLPVKWSPLHFTWSSKHCF